MVHHRWLESHASATRTTRAAHQITETPEVSRALDIAAKKWPAESRARLLLRLVAAGCDVIDDERAIAAECRRDAVARTSGKYADVFDSDYLPELRRDWAQ